MTEEEKLQKAYFVLGLEPGSPLDSINRRHKRLIMVWHPDRFPTEDGKKDAEEELKKINNAKDDLKKHFEQSHKASGACACKPSQGASTQSSNQGSGRSGQGPGPGPGKRKTTQENNREEAEAQRRSREREAQAAAEAAEKERQRQAAASAQAAQQSAQAAAEQTKLLADERLRWKLSLCIGAAWIGLSLFGWAGTSLKAWWHDFSWKWDRDHPSTPPATQSEAPSSTPGYVPPYNQFPGGEQSTWQQQQDADQKRRDEQAERQKKQDIYDTRMALDRYQKTIDHCTQEIAKVDAQLADPSVSDYEKRKSASCQSAQRGYLAQAQSDLAEAQKRFTELTGRPASEANTTDWGPDSSPTIAPSLNNSSSLLNGTNFSSSSAPPVINSDPIQPWRPAYSPSTAPGLTPLNTSPSPLGPTFNQDSLFNTDPSKSTNPIFRKQNYLFREPK